MNDENTAIDQHQSVESSSAESNPDAAAAPAALSADAENEQCSAAQSAAALEPAAESGDQGSPELPLTEDEELGAVEALLFVHGEPLDLDRLASATNLESTRVEVIVAALRAKYEAPESGVEIVSVGNAIQLRTKARFGNVVRQLRISGPRKLSRAALETLAVVAYRQPVIKSDIEKIRGVDPTPTLKTLLDRSLIKIVGHQATVGQPALYGTTDEFLTLFSLKSLSELPTLRDLTELEGDPGESGESRPDIEGTEQPAQANEDEVSTAAPSEEAVQ